MKFLKRFLGVEKRRNSIRADNVSTDFFLTISCGPVKYNDRTGSTFCVYVDEGTLDVGSEVLLKIHNSETRIKVLKIFKQLPNTNAVFDTSTEVKTATSKESNVDNCTFWIDLDIDSEEYYRVTKRKEPILCGSSYSPVDFH